MSDFYLKCVEKCDPTLYTVGDQLKCLATCPVDYFINGSDCLKLCPPLYYGDVATKSCQKCA
jgi:hypothetical protein